MNADNYFESVVANQSRQEAMKELREMIKSTFPKIQEGMDYKLPTYKLEDGNFLCSIASQKHYMALYIMPHDLLINFERQLGKYNCGKSCIRFKKLTENDLDLFQKILTYCAENYSESQFFGKYS